MWRFTTLFCVAVAVFIPLEVVAQEAENTRDLVRELHLLGARADQAVTLLQQMLIQRADEIELRRLQVAVLALQLRSTSIGDIEARVQTLQDRAAEAREYFKQLETELQRIDRLIVGDSTSEEEKAVLELSREQIQNQIDLAQQRVWSLERHALDLENDLAAKRRDLEALEEIVMEGLSDF